MTYTVVAVDHDTGVLGLATVSHSFNVVAKTVHPSDPAMDDVLLASQAFSSRSLGSACLAHLRAGGDPDDAAGAWLRADGAATLRQVVIATRDRGCAAYTGGDCIASAGHHVDPTGRFAVAGNMLQSPQVLLALRQGFEAAREAGHGLAEALLVALDKATAAGGDFRGDRSAGLVLRGGRGDVDLRVLHAEAPVSELWRQYRRWQDDEAVANVYRWLLAGSSAEEAPALARDVGARRVELGIDAEAIERLLGSDPGEDSGASAAVARLTEGLARAGAVVRARPTAAQPRTTVDEHEMRELLQAPVHLVGYRPAGDVVSGVGRRRYLHSGPPLEPGGDLPGALVGALIAGLIFEGEAADPQQARRLVATGEVELVSGQDVGVAGPLTGLVTPRTPVVVVERADGRRFFSPLHEGEIGGMRAGHFDEGTLARLERLAGLVAPALDGAVGRTTPIDVTQLQASALRRGDECHNRNVAATQMLIATLAPAIVRGTPRAAEVLDVLVDTPQHTINLSAATAAAVLDLVGSRGPAGLVVGIGMNGREVGIRVSGVDGWFVGPAPTGPVLPFPGGDVRMAQPGQGDSVIIEGIGLGAFALSAALPLARRLGRSVEQARATVAAMRAITAMEHPLFRIPDEGFRGTPACIDVRAVVDSGVTPAVTLGYLHREPGHGRVGVGLASLPLAPFEAAARSLATSVVATTSDAPC